MAASACTVALKHVSLARQLLHQASSDAVVCAAAALLQRQAICNTMQMCTYYWVFLVLLFGFPQRNALDAPEHQVRKEPWAAFVRNVTMQLWRIRGKDMRELASEKLHFYGHAQAPEGNDASTSAMLLLYADSDHYFSLRHVAPFVEQLRCYTSRHGIRFALDSKGLREPYEGFYILNRSIEGEFYFSHRGHNHTDVDFARNLISDLFDKKRLERAVELIDVQETLAMNYAHPYQFGRIWALSEHLSTLVPGALLLFFDADVTIRPDSWHHSLAELLLAQSSISGSAPHVYIADTWMGIECVNSGFFAVRNTDVGHVFLETWKEKLRWASSWDQAALAETVLEIVGAETWKISGGQKGYDGRCLDRLFPLPDGTYTYSRYCDCWQATLSTMVGSYRQRLSRIVGFVDPEMVEVNFIPNNLFWDHHYTLSTMHLAHSQPVFTPFVIHWAGMGERRLALMQDFLETFDLNSTDTCPALKSKDQAITSLGTKARHFRCCTKLRKYADKSAWPWSLPDNGWLHWTHYWGCNDWRSVIAEDCDELLGPTDTI